LLALDVDPYYQAAVAAEGEDLEFKLWDWNLWLDAVSPGQGWEHDIN
jgi:hypothetical protein